MVPFWKYLKKHKWILLSTLILAMINQVFSLLDPQIFRMLIDNYATKVGELETSVFINGVLLLLLAFMGVALVSRIAKNFQDYYASVITQRVGANIYTTSVEHTFSLPFFVFEDRRSGEILSKLQKARTDSQVLIENLINVVFLSLVGIIFVIIYASTVHWLIGVTYLLMIPIIGISTFLLSKKIREAQKSVVAESAELAGSTTETLRNVELVRSLGLERQEINRLNKVTQKILDLELKKIRLIRKLSFIQGTILNFLRAGLTLIILILMLKGNVTIGEFFSLFVYSFFIFTPLSSIGTVAAQYQEARASNEQLEEILKIKPEEKPKKPERIKSIKSIEYKDVDFSYSSNEIRSIEKLNLKIKNGETIAFAGISGSGKTTLIKLLVGLYKPTKGKLLFNEIDSRKVDYEDIRMRIGFVSQETQLFAGTIRENLLFVNPNAIDKEMIKALKSAALDYILQRGNKGLNNKIGEGGIKLSGGEKQRLSIARALLRSPDILIFDEATSNLDSMTEKGIIETLNKIIKERPNLITIMVAHRLSTIAHADKIYILNKGKLIEQGRHKDLLKKNGIYAALWKQQSLNGN